MAKAREGHHGRMHDFRGPVHSGYESVAEDRRNAVQRPESRQRHETPWLSSFDGRCNGDDSINPGDTVDPVRTGKDGIMAVPTVQTGKVKEPQYLEGEANRKHLQHPRSSCGAHSCTLNHILTGCPKVLALQMEAR